MKLAFHLHFDLLHCGPLSDEMKDRAARYDWGHLAATTDVMDAAGAMDYSQHAALSAEFRARNPDHKTGWYCGGIGGQRKDNPAWHWLTDDDLLHTPDGRALWAPIDGADTKIINLASFTTQRMLIDHYTDFLKTCEWHGLMLDSYSPAFYADWVYRVHGLTNGCREGPAHLPGWWEDAIGTFSERLRWTLAQHGYEVMAVGIAPGEMTSLGPSAMWHGYGSANIVDYASGAIFEHPHRGYGKPVFFEHALAACKAVTDKHRGLFFSVAPRLAYDTGDVPQQETSDLQRFYQAMYYLIQEPPDTSYGYHPFWPYRGWNDEIKPYVYWADDWSLPDLGIPTGPYGKQTTALGTCWYRRYNDATVVVNPSTTYQQLRLDGRWRVWDRANGPLIDMAPAAPDYWMNIPPLTGWLLWGAG